MENRERPLSPEPRRLLPPRPSVLPSPGASRSGPLLGAARAPARLSPGPATELGCAVRPSSRSSARTFPRRPEAPGRARGGERAGTRGPVGGRVRGAGAGSPRGAEPGQSEALSPAEGPLRRRRGPRVLRLPGPRGIGTACGARRPPRSLLAASRLLRAHPAPGFQRRPGARSSCGDGTPDPARPRALRARRLPRWRGFPERPAERQPQPRRCGRRRRRRRGTRGRLGFWLRRPPRL